MEQHEHGPTAARSARRHPFFGQIMR